MARKKKKKTRGTKRSRKGRGGHIPLAVLEGKLKRLSDIVKRRAKNPARWK